MVIAPAARQDLSDAFDYIAADKPLAAAKWVEAIERKCRLVAAMPDSGQRRPEFGEQIRSSLFGRYVIFYRPIADGAEIVRIIAGERDIRTL
ncbi:type II toxin-antitoxin system RelE/ParE family toxin [Blastopirellula marina]|uniref:Type II toxin-antitoxin system RelE/ParE family toxin n=1 Tax=Blastopirellula marina TaxID=124 RepID=A0A2S8FWJ9_9BACT|nr:type II toxin-antitoxin system RelE/ParE family toxin [Blastopirellula marina]PQO47520.1 type II toxin-antitoxin system RelE/ParE family toxin [Blastopirellula marina]PTL44394.1 type II toxin-antitoxin system RelE/ParE family toxin [Blastopirellula marina]